MKQPHSRNARSGFQATSEISAFVHESPPSVETPRNVILAVNRPR
jgi:hypothetical protein